LKSLSNCQLHCAGTFNFPTSRWEKQNKQKKMKVELNQKEVEIINEALELWQTKPTSDSLFDNMLGAMLCPKEERENEKIRLGLEMKSAQQKVAHRKAQSILLQAKLMQAQALESEHDLDHKV
jgi:hypothetical protein